MKFSKVIICSFVTCCVIGATASLGLATPINSVDSSYGEATHKNPKWQNLNDPTNTTDTLGVSWSVDGGSTYGRFDLTAGQNVIFKINMVQPNQGSHYANFAKMWIDTDQNYSFETDESVAFEKVVLRTTQNGSFVADTADYPYATFTTNYTIADYFVGDLSIRTRVTCSESLRDSGAVWGTQWNMTDAHYDRNFVATGVLNQGEVEDWTVTVNPVPEPGAMLMFGAGIACLAGAGRRRKK